MSNIQPLTATINILKKEGQVNVNGLIAVALEEAFSHLTRRQIMDVCGKVREEQNNAWDAQNERQEQQVKHFKRLEIAS